MKAIEKINDTQIMDLNDIVSAIKLFKFDNTIKFYIINGHYSKNKLYILNENNEEIEGEFLSLLNIDYQIINTFSDFFLVNNLLNKGRIYDNIGNDIFYNDVLPKFEINTKKHKDDEKIIYYQYNDDNEYFQELFGDIFVSAYLRNDQKLIEFSNGKIMKIDSENKISKKGDNEIIFKFNI